MADTRKTLFVVPFVATRDSVHDAIGDLVAHCYRPLLRDDRPWHALDAECEQTARLFAAAPDLLTSLIEMLDNMDDLDLAAMPDGVPERARDAIAKATAPTPPEGREAKEPNDE